MDLVSVIIPTFNSRNWITQCIDSVLAQTYAHFELIVVDDGSRDGTVGVVKEKLRKVSNNNWRILELARNEGASAARNRGLGASSGTWIQFLDSDDFISSVKLERQMAYCANAPSEVAAVYSPWRRGYFDGGKISWEGPLVKPNMKGKDPIMCLVAACRPLHVAGLCRRTVLEQIGGFDEDLRFWECEEINVRIAQTGRFEEVDLRIRSIFGACIATRFT